MLDLRLALRTHRSTPVVTIVATVSLALGIGATTAIFSIVDSLLLRPLPVDRPHRLAVLMSMPTGVTPGLSSWSNPVWEQIRERRHELFQTAFAFSTRTTRFNLAPAGQTEFIDGLWVSGDYFDGLGVQPALGRTLTAADDTRGGGRHGAVAVISYAFWQRRFGGAADVIGRTQVMDRVPFTIVGVTPPAFFGANVGRAHDRHRDAVTLVPGERAI
ncbi:MAG TPA: ABC transporter permease [Gemmatimonadaceae bacterium]|nr:ABC transporter permease [Gemmatimonadaceae bacterium]